VILFEANARDVPPAVSLVVLFHPLVHGLFKLRSRSCPAGPGTCSDVRSGSMLSKNSLFEGRLATL
jgi:hypothetical protein